MTHYRHHPQLALPIRPDINDANSKNAIPNL